MLASVLALFPGNGVNAPANLPPSDPLFSVVAQEDGGDQAQQEGDETPTEPDRIIGLVDVVVAQADIPVGERLRPELLTVERRPSDNIAVRVGVTYSDIALLDGQIAKIDISEGQAVLAPMIALSSTDLANIGSDLALFVDRSKVAVAFPISRYSGASYGMRPGDFVDVLMSFNMIELDIEFQTALPNKLERVDEAALDEGLPFLFPSTSSGRLEVIPELNNTIVSITPKGLTTTPAPMDGTAGTAAGDATAAPVTTSDGFELLQRPRRVTQLTLQQVEVLWVGTWDDPDLSAVSGTNPVPLPQRGELRPDVVILSLPVQDALVLKWALEEPGADIDLALRSQGDNALYFTTSVSLPQLVEQAGLSIPEPAQFDLQPRIDGTGIPRLSPRSQEDQAPPPPPVDEPVDVGTN